MKRDIGSVVKRINDCIEKKANQNLKDYGLTLTQVRVLFYLYERKDAITSQKNIEDAFAVAHPTVVGILKRLEEKGLIYCSIDHTDRRMKNVYLTELINNVYEDISDKKAKLEYQLVAGLSNSQIEQLRDTLATIYENIK